MRLGGCVKPHNCIRCVLLPSGEIAPESRTRSERLSLAKREPDLWRIDAQPDTTHQAGLFPHRRESDLNLRFAFNPSG